jgi:hypothetical protein
MIYLNAAGMLATIMASMIALTIQIMLIYHSPSFLATLIVFGVTVNGWVARAVIVGRTLIHHQLDHTSFRASVFLYDAYIHAPSSGHSFPHVNRFTQSSEIPLASLMYPMTIFG